MTSRLQLDFTVAREASKQILISEVVTWCGACDARSARHAGSFGISGTVVSSTRGERSALVTCCEAGQQHLRVAAAKAVLTLAFGPYHPRGRVPGPVSA